MYAIRPILKLLLLAVPFVCGLLFAVQILRQRQLQQIKEGLPRYRKAFPRIFAASVLGGVLCMLFLLSGMSYYGSFKMSFTYPKASKGLTPNSTTLDVSEIVGSKVLRSAVETGNLGDLSPEEVKSALSVSNVKGKGAVSTKDLYVSTEYEVVYRATEKTASIDKNRLLETVADSYYTYFTDSYGRKTDILENDYSEISNLDYLDVYKYLDSQVSNIIDYLEMCRTENGTFVSGETQESFASVKDKAKNFKDVSLERYQAYVLKYGLSQDSGQYISRLNYENRLTNVEYLKNLAAYQVRIAAIERYDGDITRAVLVPTRDDTGEFYQSRTKIGTDYFASEANSHLEFATKNQLNIETNNYHIQSLSAASGGEEQRKEADQMVENLKTEILSITKQAVETIEDYDAQTSNGYISFVFQDKKSYVRSNLMKTLLYTGGLFVALSVVVFTGADAPLRRKKKQDAFKVI